MINLTDYKQSLRSYDLKQSLKFSVENYNDFFLFLGGLLIIVVIIYFLFRNLLKDIFISDEEVSKIKAESKTEPQGWDQKTIPFKVILLVIIIGGFLLNQFLMWKMNSLGILSKLIDVNINITRK